jgi:hypothetical protein
MKFICILFLALVQSISCSGDFNGLGGPSSGGPSDISSAVLVLIISIVSAIAISNLDKYPSGAANAAKEVSNEVVLSAEQADKALKIAEGNLLSIKNEGLNKVANYNLQNYFHGSPEYLDIASALVIYFVFAVFIIYAYDLWGIPEFIHKFFFRYRNISIVLIYFILLVLILFSKL